MSLQYNQCHRILHEVDVYKSQKGMTHRRTMAKSLEKREWTPSVNLLCYFCGGLCLFFFIPMVHPKTSCPEVCSEPLGFQLLGYVKEESTILMFLF